MLNSNIVKLFELLQRDKMTLEEITKALNLKERTVYQYINILNNYLEDDNLNKINKVGKTFFIDTMDLEIKNQFLEKYSSLTPEERRDYLCAKILLKDSLDLNIEKDILDISKSTLSTDLKIISNFLKENNLSVLIDYPFMGVNGEEKYIQKILFEKLTKLSFEESNLKKVLNNFLTFVFSNINLNKLFFVYSKLFEKYDIYPSNYIFVVFMVLKGINNHRYSLEVFKEELSTIDFCDYIEFKNEVLEFLENNLHEDFKQIEGEFIALSLYNTLMGFHKQREIEKFEEFLKNVHMEIFKSGDFLSQNIIQFLRTKIMTGLFKVNLNIVENLNFTLPVKKTKLNLLSKISQICEKIYGHLHQEDLLDISGIIYPDYLKYLKSKVEKKKIAIVFKYQSGYFLKRIENTLRTDYKIEDISVVPWVYFLSHKNHNFDIIISDVSIITGRKSILIDIFNIEGSLEALLEKV